MSMAKQKLWLYLAISAGYAMESTKLIERKEEEIYCPSFTVMMRKIQNLFADCVDRLVTRNKIAMLIIDKTT